MALHKIKDFDSNYHEHFDDQDILNFDLYSGNEKIGTVNDLLVDDDGNFRYLVINTGSWIFGKKVLLPIGRARLEFDARRVYVDGLSRTQVENLPEYTGTMPVDYEHEERVRDVYRPMASDTGLATPASYDRTDYSDEMSATSGYSTSDAELLTPSNYDRSGYDYQREPGLYDINERNHQNLKLYEERLIANKNRHKTGEVTVGKRVETEQTRVEVPLEKERIVIERNTPTDASVNVAPGEEIFGGGEVARMEVYEETPDIRKEAFVREEVNVRKEVDRNVETVEDQIRREQLDIETDGQPIIDGGNELRR